MPPSTPQPDTAIHAFPVERMLLQSASHLNVPCGCMSILCGSGSLLASLLAPPLLLPTLLFVCGTASGIYGLWLCWRLHLDSLLFTALGNGSIHEAELDAGIGWFTGKAAPQRTMENRWAGTRALYWRLLATIPLSCACFIVGVLGIFW